MRRTSGELADALRLCVVLDPDQVTDDVVSLAAEAVDGGATSIQLRSKRHSDRETLDLATRILSEISGTPALFFVNDRIDIALACDADGVHLGVDDLPLEKARSIAGEGIVIGYSPETDQQATSAASRGADYLGVGPVFGTRSKSDAGVAIGLPTLARRASLAGIPVMGIGGINETNARDVVAAGACGVAVISAVTQAPSPKQACRKIVATVDRAHVKNRE